MKKLLSICFLSILLTLLSFTAQAQSRTNCCFWLENMQPDTLTGIVNAPNGAGTVVLNNTMNPVLHGLTQNGEYQQTDVYKIHFTNNCNLPAGTKVSLEWKLYRDGQLVNGNLSDYADFRIYTNYGRLNHFSVSCASIPWIGGQVRDGHGQCCPNSNDPTTWVEGYPGAMHAGDQSSLTFNGTTYGAPGAVTFGNDYLSLDYFNLPFFEATDHVIMIRWKQVGNYSLVVSLRERRGGTDFTSLYWNDAQTLSIGGHQSCCGDILASDSIHYLVTTSTSKEVCDGTTFTYGQPPYDFTNEGVYNVIFGKDTCGRFLVNRLDTFHFYTRINPEVVVSNNNPTICFNDPFTSEDLSALVSYDPTEAPGNPTPQFMWSLDNEHFSTTVPTPGLGAMYATTVYHYYVRQRNVYNNFGEIVNCDGPIQTINFTVNPLPRSPQVTSPVYLCVNDQVTLATAGYVIPVPDDPDTYIQHWSTTPTFTNEITTVNTSVAGTQNYYVYLENAATHCMDKTHYSTVAVTVYDLPRTTATATPSTVCLGEPVTLNFHDTLANLSGNYRTSYLWTSADVRDNNFTPNNYSNNVITVPAFVGNNHVYYLNVTKNYVRGNHNCYRVDTLHVAVNPVPAAPTVNINICNESASGDYTITPTLGANGTTIRWYDYQTGALLYTGLSHTIALGDYPHTNVDTIVNLYKITSYNERTGCETALTSATTVALKFHQTPEGRIAPADLTMCPSRTMTISAEITSTQTDPAYSYVWSGNVTNTHATSNFNYIHSTAECGASYTANVLVTDANGCHATFTKTIVAQDVNHIYFAFGNERTDTTIFNQTFDLCSVTELPAQASNIGAFKELVQGHDYRIIDNCSNLSEIESVTNVVENPNALCDQVLSRTYVVVDSCGNHGVFVHRMTLHENTAPTFKDTNYVVLTPVINPANCTYNVPSRATLLASMQANFPPTDNCTSTDYLYENAQFYLSGSSYPANTPATHGDIFAGGYQTVYVDVVITDQCGNSTRHTNFKLNRPAPMTITDNSIAISKDSLCLGDSVTLMFSDAHVLNAALPFTYLWTARPNDGSIVFNTHATAFGVPASADSTYYYTITVTDANHCVASAVSHSVYVKPIPVASIHPVPGNLEFPLCPSYGMLTLEATAASNIANPALTYAWSGESVNQDSVHTRTGVYIIPTRCTYTYTAYLKVTNGYGCSYDASYTFNVADNQAPIVNGLITDMTLPYSDNCQVIIPNLTNLVTANNTHDNCYLFGDLHVTQIPAAGQAITTDSVVYLHVADYCGNVGVYAIRVHKPANSLNVAINASSTVLCGGETVSLNAVPSNASGLVQYAWTLNNNTNVLSTSNTYQTIPAEGTPVYTVTVHDALGCVASNSITLTVHHTPIATDLILASTPNTYCANTRHIGDGTIFVSHYSSSIPAGYQFRMNGTNVWYDANDTITGLEDGTYHFDVKSNYDCIHDNLITVVVGKDTTIHNMSTAVPTANYYCSTPFNGTITVVNPYVNCTYNIIDVPYSTRYYTTGNLIYSEIPDGQYSIHVLTDKFCNYQILDIIVIDSTIAPALSPADYSVASQSNCQFANGSITLLHPVIGTTYTLGSTSFTASTNAPYTFSNLVSGDMVINMVNAYRCHGEAVIHVDGPAILEQPGYSAHASTICSNETGNGSLTIAAALNYTYSIDGGAPVTVTSDSITFSNLTVGNHTVNITTDQACIRSFIYSVPDGRANAILPSISTIGNVVCVYSSAHPFTGSVNITNPLADYAYTLSYVDQTYTMDASHSFTQLMDGSYQLFVLDSLTGCSNNREIIVPNNTSEPVINATDYRVVNNTACYNSGNPYYNGQIIITDPDIANYHYTCYRLTSFVNSHAPVSVRISGYDWDGEEVGLTNLPGGNYILVKTDIRTGCATSVPVSISNIQSIYTITSSSVSDITCDPTNGNGSITITNYNSNYSYTYSDADNTYAFTSATASNLTAGTYTVSLYDSYTHCTYASSVTVGTNYVYPSITGSATANYFCNDSKNGTVTLSSNNTNVSYWMVKGNEDHAVLVSNPVTGLDSGPYHFYAVSQYGCESNLMDITVVDSAFIIMRLAAVENSMCAPTFTHPGNGQIIVLQPQSAHIDYSFYNYSASNADNLGSLLNVNYFVPASYTMYHMFDGKYTVVITDSTRGCVGKDTITVPKSHYTPNISVASTNVINCSTPDGTITVTATATDSHMVGHTFMYALDATDNDYNRAYQYSNVFTGLAAGSYTVMVKDTDLNCEYEVNDASTVVSTAANVAPQFTFATTNASNDIPFAFCHNTLDATIYVNNVYSTVPNDNLFTYSWSNASTTSSAAVNTLVPNSTATYTVSVTSALTNCTTIQRQTVTILSSPAILFTHNGFSLLSNTLNICNNETPTNIGVKQSYANYAWSYYPNMVASTQTIITGAINNGGNVPYHVTVTDAHGCSNSSTLTVYGLPTYEIHRDTTICATEPTFFVHQTLQYNYAAGANNVYTVYDSLHTVFGCDSVIIYNVTLHARPIITLDNNFSEIMCDDSAFYSTGTGMTVNPVNYQIDNPTEGWVVRENSSLNFDPTHVSYSLDGYHVYYVINSSCGTAYSDTVQLKIDSLPEFTGALSINPLCAGSHFALTFDQYNCHNRYDAPGCTYWWQISSDNVNFESWSSAAPNGKYLMSDNGKYVRVALYNRCHIVYSNSVQLVIDTIPTPTLSSNAYCAGSVLSPILTSYTQSATALLTIKTMLNGIEYHGRPLTYPGDSAAALYLVLSNRCGTYNTDTIQIVTSDIPQVAPINAVTLCAGETLNLVNPQVASNNSVLTHSGWLYKAPDSTHYVTTTLSNINNNFNVLANNGYTLAYYAVNSCGADTSFMTLTVHSIPTITGNFADISTCAGSTISLPAVTVNNNGSVLIEQAYEISTDIFSTYSTITSSTIIPNSWNGAKIRYHASNACGDAYSDPFVLTVNDTAQLVLPRDLYHICAIQDTQVVKVSKKATNSLSVTVSNPAILSANVNNLDSTITVIALRHSADMQYVYVKSASVCGNLFDTIKVYADSLPAPVITSVPAVCVGETIIPVYQLNPNVIANNAWPIPAPGIVEDMIHSFDGGISAHFIWSGTPETSWDDNMDQYANTTYSLNGHNIQLVETNYCGTSYSNSVAVVINDTAKLVANSALTFNICNGSSISIPFTTNKNVTVTGLDAVGHLSLAQHNGLDTISGIINGTVGSHTVSITTNDQICPDYNKTLTYTINIMDAPVIELTHYNDTICAGSVYNNIPNGTVSSNGSIVTAHGWLIKKVDDSVWSAFNPTTTLDVSYDNSQLVYYAKNACDSVVSDVITLHVAGGVTVGTYSLDTLCSGSTFADVNASAPTLTTSGSLRIVAQGWQYLNSDNNFVNLSNDFVLDRNIQVRYYVLTSPACGDHNGYYYSSVKTLKVDSVPSFTTELAAANFVICHNNAFTLTVPSYTSNGSAVSGTIWQLVKGTTIMPLTSTTLVSDTMNNATIRCIISNRCGYDTSSAVVTVNSLPTPHAHADTTICLGTQALIGLNTIETGHGYAWYLDDATTPAHIGGSFQPTLGEELLGTATKYYQYIVYDTIQATGCVASDTMVVKVSDLPQFIFRNDANVETHNIYTTTSTNNFTKYSVMIDEHCWNPDTLVFLDIYVYHNGQLIPNDSMARYFVNQIRTVNSVTTTWNSKDSLNWLSTDYHALNYVTYYHTSHPDPMSAYNGSHYPNSSLYYNSQANVFDDFYLHFLNQRPIYVTFAPFIRSGEYKIVYKLYSTNNPQRFQRKYTNQYEAVSTSDTAMYMGGQNSIASGSILTLLAWDTMNIHVGGVDMNPSLSPVLPQTAPEVSTEATATVKLYPNPAVDQVNADIKGISGKTVIRIVNLSGKILSEETINIPETGLYHYTHSMSSFVPGVYFVYVSNENATITKKLVVTK